MAHKIVINPGTPQAWEMQLRPGPNRVGRGEQNDVRINHPSISTVHCEFNLGSDGVLLKDLGSTNGTFVDRAPVQEMLLRPGCHVQLGSVDMIFEAPVQATVVARPAPSASAPIRISMPVAPAPTAAPTTASAPVAPVAPGSVTIKPRLSISRPAEPAAESAPPPPTVVRAPIAPEAHPATTRHAHAAKNVGKAYCKFHQKTLARFQCDQCGNFFCDLCVTTRNVGGVVGKYCRSCGVEVTPVQVHMARGDRPKGFFALLPAAFIYPFRGAGVMILIIATILFAALDFVSGGFAILMKMAALGYLFSFMQNIIHATAAEEKELPGLPEFDGLFAAFFEFAGTVGVAFGVPIALWAWAFFGDQQGLGLYIMVTTVLGCLYFPMAFLAVAMKDSVAAANPLVVIPAILKVPL
ncbi:MAG: FHA domain-containing protein, partial [Verrucomicrobia bacterium]